MYYWKIIYKNKHNLDIAVFFYRNDEDECVEEVSAGTTSVLPSIKKNVVYTVGFHADVEENT